MLPYIITAVVAIIVTAIAVWFMASAYQRPNLPIQRLEMLRKKLEES